MAERFMPLSEYEGDQLAAALGTEPRTLRDVVHGDGEIHAVAEGKAALEVYPRSGVARVTTSDTRVELYRVPGLRLNGSEVVFEQGSEEDRTRLLVAGDGKVTFSNVVSAPESRSTAQPPEVDLKVASPPSTAQEASQGLTDGNAEARQSEHGEAKEAEIIQLTGRLGRDPWFRTNDELPLAGFPLAVNDETGGPTTWHKVVISGEAVTQLQEAARKGQIRKGRLVAVTGQEVVRKEDTAQGGIRTVREFRASAVSRVSSGKTQPDRSS